MTGVTEGSVALYQARYDRTRVRPQLVSSRMALHELHPFSESEIERLPRKRGVYVLFQIEAPIHADGAVNLHQALSRAKAEFPQASHFSVEALDSADAMKQRVHKLREELHLVRAAGFVGARR